MGTLCGATHLIQLEGGIQRFVGAFLEVGAHVVPHHAHVTGPGFLGYKGTQLLLVGELGWSIPWEFLRLQSSQGNPTFWSCSRNFWKS